MTRGAWFRGRVLAHCVAGAAPLRRAIICKGIAMHRIAIMLCAAAVGFSAPSYAQAPAPATAAAATAEAKPVAAYKFVEPRVIADYPLPSKSDPRVCLEFPTQQQIIACANRYLPRRK